MAISRRSMILGSAVAGTSAVALSACGGGSGGGTNGGSDGGSGSGGGEPVLVNGSEPENPLIPTNTSETGGGKLIQVLFAGLVYYTADGKVENEVAESIESEDKQTWTITIKKDQKFSDGTPVTAKSFVDAWNYGALTTNAQKGQSFFEPIEGFADVAAEKPTAQTMKGLTVTDDQTFTVKLVSPQSDFPNRLGYSAYMPLPEAGLKDMKAFGEKPVGNGPYTLESWEHDKQAVVVKNDAYTGPRASKNDGLTFVFYSDPETAYNDLTSDSVDVVDSQSFPTSVLSSYQDDLGDRAVNDPGAVFQSFTIPQNLPGFTGEPGKLRRQAISYAIDRTSICDSLFFGTRTPATDFVAPVIDGGGATDIPGKEVLTFDAAKAKQLWQQAEGMEPFTGDFTIAYNADGPHKDWVDAVCNSIRNTLGINAAGKPFPAFGEMRKQITARQLKSAFRSGWQADYPSVYNFLGPLYSTAAADGKGSNDGDYKNPEFDKLLTEGLAAPDAKAALEKYKAAQAILLQDLPVIPLWYQNTFGGYGESVDNVEFGWDTVPLYHEVTKG